MTDLDKDELIKRLLRSNDALTREIMRKERDGESRHVTHIFGFSLEEVAAIIARHENATQEVNP